jgi:H+/Cl- antiporter ClcA
MNAYIKHKIEHNVHRAVVSVKWVIFSILVGTVVGLCGTAFYYGMSYVTGLRTAHPWLIFLLPVGGLAIVGLYRVFRDEKDTGTNLVISAIHSGDELPFKMAPLIFVSTLITHLFGGSAGREGAALQMGGSIGNTLGKLFRFDEKDKHVMIMCGMSAAFSALFGTPMAAAIFPMEMVSVGVMYYIALVPCVISSLVAHGIAVYFGVANEMFLIEEIPAFGIITAVKISVLAVLCALLSILFCVILHQTEELYKHFFKNPFVRVFAGGCVVVLLTLLVGSQSYNGTGINIIEQCIDGSVRPEAFLLKMIFTAATLGAGYKGGEIVPSFFTGAAFGCLFGNLIGFSPTLCTAVGMTSVFCGVTNSPITSLLISFELFGYDGMPYFLLAISFSYMLSGYFGLYRSQKIVYSKFKTNYINKTTH